MLIVLGGLFGLGVLIALILFGAYKSTWSNLNRMNQDVNGAESRYSAALEVCSEKIKGVWQIANQYMDHESETFKAVAEARSGYAAAKEAYANAKKEGNMEEMTRAGNQAMQSALAINVQIEAYPQLKASETTKENIRNFEESANEIKTALDDWISYIEAYNTYRGDFWPNIFGGFMRRFPVEIKYFKGDVERLDVDSLNPQKS